MSENQLTRPYFVPAGIAWETLPESHRIAITTIVQPVYEEYVVNAADPLERSAGSSIASCLVMELLDQFEVGSLLARAADPKDAQQDHERLFSRLLRTTAVKQKLTDGLMRLRGQRVKIATMDPFIARRVFGAESAYTRSMKSSIEGIEAEDAGYVGEKCDENE